MTGASLEARVLAAIPSHYGRGACPRWLTARLARRRPASRFGAPATLNQVRRALARLRDKGCVFHHGGGWRLCAPVVRNRREANRRHER